MGKLEEILLLGISILGPKRLKHTTKKNEWRRGVLKKWEVTQTKGMRQNG